MTATASNPGPAAVGQSPYEELNRLHRALAQSPSDAGLRLRAAQGLARIGLFGAAADLVEPLRDASPEIAPIHATFAAQPRGDVEWSSLRSRFEQNLAAASARFESCRQHAAALRNALEELELHRSSDGAFQLARPSGDGLRDWLPFLGNDAREAERADLSVLRRGMLTPPYLLEGVAFGALLRRVLIESEHCYLNYSPHVHLLEPNLAQFAAWLHSDDLRELLATPRLHLWIGPNAAQDLTAWLLADDRRGRPIAVIEWPRWGETPSVARRVLSAVGEHDEAAHHRRRTTLREALHGERGSFAHYAARFAGHRTSPLRIMAVTSRHTTFLQHSVRDFGAAAVRAGHTFRMLIEPDDAHGNLPPTHTVGQLVDFQPDLVLVIDHNRCEFPGQYDFPIPFVNWVQDNLPQLFEPGVGRRCGPYDLLLGNLVYPRAIEAGYPWAQCRYATVPVSLEKFSAEPVDAALSARHACDIAYVSHLSTTADAFLREIDACATDRQTRQLIHAVCEELRGMLRRKTLSGLMPQIIGVTQQVAARLGLPLRPEQANLLRVSCFDRYVSILVRHETLEWAAQAGVNLRIHGRGWDAHPTLARFAHPPAEHGDELRAIFQSAKVNLQVIFPSAVHQRLLEGLAAGGFFLLRETPLDRHGAELASLATELQTQGITDEAALWHSPDAALAERVRKLNQALFAPARLYGGFAIDLAARKQWDVWLGASAHLPDYDAVAFDSPDALGQRLSQYLNDESARRAIATRQRAAIVERYTYDKLLSGLLDFAAEHFQALAAQAAGTPTCAGANGAGTTAAAR